MVRRVYPYCRNFGKRLVKMPKLYFVDSGLAAWLLGIRSADGLALHHTRSALLTLLKIKSGQTFQTECLRSLETVRRHVGLPVRRALVYGGDSDMARGETNLLGWRSLAHVV